MEYPLTESAWKRGWTNTKTIWTSWQFFVLDAVVVVVIAGMFEWYWGLVVILCMIFFVWVGATASAPVRQRNEARNMVNNLLYNPFRVKIEGLHSPITNPEDSQAILRIELDISNQSDEARSISKFALMAGGSVLKPISLDDYPKVKTKDRTELVAPLYFLPRETKIGLTSFAIDKPIDVNREDKILYIYDNADVPLMVPIDIKTMTMMAKKSFTRRKEYRI